jgi:epoxyqueuosine reductase
MPERVDTAGIRGLVAGAGIEVFRLANVGGLVARLDRAAWFPRPARGSEAVLPALLRAVPDPLSGSFLACAFPHVCDRPEDRGEPPPPGSAGLVSPFARRDYYRAAVKTLRSVARSLSERAALPARAFRIFVNSRLPEKLIACGAGLGVYGRNRLLFTKECGSRFSIGLLFLPFPVEEKDDETAPPAPLEMCGACAACLAACPVKALRAGECLSGCLKARADALDPWDEAVRRAWGLRFYGCDTCQAACPRNRFPAGKAAEAVREGVIGPEIDLGSFLALSEPEIRSRFRKTALGLSWILPQALLRNALCAAGNARAPGLLPAVRRFRGDPRPLLADTARWAARMIEGESVRRE